MRNISNTASTAGRDGPQDLGGMKDLFFLLGPAGLSMGDEVV